MAHAVIRYGRIQKTRSRLLTAQCGRRRNDKTQYSNRVYRVSGTYRVAVRRCGGIYGYYYVGGIDYDN